MPFEKGNNHARKAGEKATSTMQCRIKPSELVKFHDKAKSEGLSFCAWVMRMLNK